MNRRIQLLFQILGAIACGAILALLVALMLDAFLPFLLEDNGQNAVTLTRLRGVVVAIGGLVGALYGFSQTPGIVRSAQTAMSGLQRDQLAGALLGALLGLLGGALASVAFGRLPSPIGEAVPALVLVAFTYLGATTLMNRPNDLREWLSEIRPRALVAESTPAPASIAEANSNNGHVPPASSVLLDTSVIIDGRITDISKTGFLNSSLSVPNFVLTELQHIADSPDPIRRKRGRRGLEVLNVLRTECPMPFEIVDMDVSEVREVDSKLVALARHLNCPIMTNDYNLNRVAGLQGVNVLNINDLANAVKAAHLPGEELNVKVIQEGREQGQGVGYLDDGTMVVVEDGTNHINQSLNVVVTKVLQTSAGRMIFAKVP